jgi:hypothetical protein
MVLSKMSCPVRGEFDKCELVTTSDGGQYYHFIPKSQLGTSKQPVTSARKVEKTVPQETRFKTEALKTSAGALLALIRRLNQHQQAGIDYSVINQYFLGQLNTTNTNPMGNGYILSILTYDPRNDTPLTYATVISSLSNAPSSIDWTTIWDTIDGLHFD